MKRFKVDYGTLSHAIVDYKDGRTVAVVDPTPSGIAEMKNLAHFLNQQCPQHKTAWDYLHTILKEP